MSEKNLNRCQDVFIQPQLLKGLHKYSLKFCELFWDVKMEMEFLDKLKKTLDTKGARI